MNHQLLPFSVSPKKGIVLIALLLISICAQAHVGRQDLSNLSSQDIFTVYLKLGFLHILPLGLDHILFILSLFLLSTRLKTIVLQATAFTLAHSITLACALYGLIPAAPHIVEPLIALSIAFVALENLISQELKASRIIIVFFFGLIHGLGFAGVLEDLGLPQTQYVTALISFNIGVELGQLSIILLAWFLVAKWFRNRTWYRKTIVRPASLAIAIVAIYWTLERAFWP